MVRNVGSAGMLIAMWVLTGLITIIAAVSYGELSAMFPKGGWAIRLSQGNVRKLIAFLYGWSFFAVIQTGTIAAVGVAFSKFAAYLYEPFSDENILYEMGISNSMRRKSFLLSPLFSDLSQQSRRKKQQNLTDGLNHH
jgi:APA family basic amino acid/polyamine antiporter